MTYIEHKTVIVKLENAAPSGLSSEVLDIIKALTLAIEFLSNDPDQTLPIYVLSCIIEDLMPTEDQVSYEI